MYGSSIRLIVQVGEKEERFQTAFEGREREREVTVCEIDRK